MKVPQKLAYACQVLVQLAKQYDGRSLSRLEDLAQAEDLSSNFLVQILNDLRRANLVESRRGKTGGYLLARRPEEISLYDITEAIEGRVLELRETNQGASSKAVENSWIEMGNLLKTALEAKTLDQFLKHEEEPMFYI